MLRESWGHDARLAPCLSVRGQRWTQKADAALNSFQTIYFIWSHDHSRFYHTLFLVSCSIGGDGAE